MDLKQIDAAVAELVAFRAAGGPHLEPNTPEWDRAWAKLAAHPLNAGVPRPTLAEGPHGDCWQYMGTYRGQHQFRHRNHPTTGCREYVNVEASR